MALRMHLALLLGDPSEATKDLCMRDLEKLEHEHRADQDTGKELVALGLMLVALPEPMTTAVGLALVAAGKKMSSRRVSERDFKLHQSSLPTPLPRPAIGLG